MAAAHRSFAEYVKKRFDNNFWAAAESYLEQNLDSLGIELRRIHRAGETEISDVKVEHVWVEDKPEMEIHFDVAVSIWFETHEGDYYYDDYDENIVWIMAHCHGDLDKNLDDFEILRVSKYNGKSRVKDPMDDSLVPVMNKNELDEIAEQFLRSHYKKALLEPTWIDPIELASSMGLMVRYENITKDGSVFGRSYFCDCQADLYNPKTDEISPPENEYVELFKKYEKCEVKWEFLSLIRECLTDKNDDLGAELALSLISYGKNIEDCDIKHYLYAIDKSKVVASWIEKYKGADFSNGISLDMLVIIMQEIIDIQVYNEHNVKRIHVANIRDRGGRNANLTDILLKFEKMNKNLPEDMRKQTIVYFNGRNKAIDAARRFSDALGYDGIKNDTLLETLSKDIRQEVHGDYFLADMIRKGIAYHIGYLPASIRARIETLFQEGHITLCSAPALCWRALICLQTIFSLQTTRYSVARWSRSISET